MIKEPAKKRVIAFVDGQSLFRAAKDAFGYIYPNYDIKALAETVCKNKGWELNQVRFYTGIPDMEDDSFWNKFWVVVSGDGSTTNPTPVPKINPTPVPFNLA